MSAAFFWTQETAGTQDFLTDAIATGQNNPRKTAHNGQIARHTLGSDNGAI
jgi:hypothetical protein